MTRRIVFVILLGMSAFAIAFLTGCPPKEQTTLQGAPPPAPPPAPAPAATHTMPGGEQMPGMEHPATPAATPAAKSEDMASCPVLGTTMAKKDMIPYEYKGKTYYFCCAPCVAKFKADPEKWIKHPTPPKPAGNGMDHP